MTEKEEQKVQYNQAQEYKKYLRARVEMLKLQYDDLFYTLEINKLQQIHKETFPELYVKQEEPVTIPSDSIIPDHEITKEMRENSEDISHLNIEYKKGDIDGTSNEEDTHES